jgi:hypothetical protein
MSDHTEQQRQANMIYMAGTFDRILDEITADAQLATGALVLSLARHLAKHATTTADLQVGTCGVAALLGHRATLEFVILQHARSQAPTKPPPPCNV